MIDLKKLLTKLVREYDIGTEGSRLDRMYPIGSYYITESPDLRPDPRLGGTWELVHSSNQFISDKTTAFTGGGIINWNSTNTNSSYTNTMRRWLVDDLNHMGYSFYPKATLSDSNIVYGTWDFDNKVDGFYSWFGELCHGDYRRIIGTGETGNSTNAIVTSDYATGINKTYQINTSVGSHPVDGGVVMPFNLNTLAKTKNYWVRTA